MVGDRTPTQRNGRVAERVALRTMAQRRWRVWRSVIVIVLITAAMVVMVKFHRDAESLTRCRENLEFAVAVFERQYKGQSLPVEFPQPRDERYMVRGHYCYRPMEVNRLGYTRPVAICYCEQPHHAFGAVRRSLSDFLRRQAVRLVLFYDGTTFEVREMLDSDLRAQAKRFDLRLR